MKRMMATFLILLLWLFATPPVCAETEVKFCLTMLPRPVASFIAMAVGMTPKWRSLIKQTTSS